MHNHTPSSAVSLRVLSSKLSKANTSRHFLLPLLIHEQQNSSPGYDCQLSIVSSGERGSIVKNRSWVKCCWSRGAIVKPTSLHVISMSAQLDLDKARASLGCFPGILPACVCKSATTFGISHKSRRPDETGTRLPLLMWQTGHQE